MLDDEGSTACEALERIDRIEPLEQSLPTLSAALLSNATGALNAAVEYVDSPIEEAMMLALCTVGLYSYYGVKINGTYTEHLGAYSESAPYVLIITPQFKVGRYRTDFMVTARNRWGDGDAYIDGSLLIECDGHDFHEKTKDQAKRDKKRNRDLQSAGFEVHHFAGSEIWADPIACAREAIDRAEARTTEGTAGEAK